jgi:tetratricopeptide (TPR) repeat protein
MRPRPWLSTSFFTCFVFTVMAVLPLAARAQQPADDTMNQAKMHFEAGKNAYNAGDYSNAIKEFKAAEALRPSPILDYNIALANEKLAKKRVAVKYYKRYLEGMPNATNRSQVEATIAQLEREIAAQPAQPEPTQPELPPTQPPPTNQPTYGAYDPYGNQGQPPVVPPQPPPKKKSYWWVALIVIGGVLLISIPVIYYVVVATSTRSSFNNGLELVPTSPNPTVDIKHAPAPTMRTLFSF